MNLRWSSSWKGDTLAEKDMTKPWLCHWIQNVCDECLGLLSFFFQASPHITILWRLMKWHFFFGSSFFPNVFDDVYKLGGSSKFQQAITLPCPPQKSCDEHLRNSWPLVAAGLSTKLIRSDQTGWDGSSSHFLHTVSCTDSVYIYILIYNIYVY